MYVTALTAFCFAFSARFSAPCPWKLLQTDELCENKGVKPQYKWIGSYGCPFFLYFINYGIQSVSKFSLSVQNYFQISLTKTILCVSFKVGSCPSCHFDLSLNKRFGNKTAHFDT